MTVVALVVLACVVLTAAVVGLWARRNFLDTDRFVDRTGPLIEEPSVQQALTNRLTEQLVTVVDPQTLFRRCCPSGVVSLRSRWRTRSRGSCAIAAAVCDAYASRARAPRPANTTPSGRSQTTSRSNRLTLSWTASSLPSSAWIRSWGRTSSSGSGFGAVRVAHEAAVRVLRCVSRHPRPGGRPARCGVLETGDRDVRYVVDGRLPPAGRGGVPATHRRAVIRCNTALTTGSRFSWRRGWRSAWCSSGGSPSASISATTSGRSPSTA